MYRDDQPLTELCERAWKILNRHGIKKEGSDYMDDIRAFTIGDWTVRCNNYNLWVDRQEVNAAGYPVQRPVFSVDEMGAVGALNITGCAEALEVFRKHSVLEDLADV